MPCYRVAVHLKPFHAQPCWRIKQTQASDRIWPEPLRYRVGMSNLSLIVRARLALTIGRAQSAFDTSRYALQGIWSIEGAVKAYVLVPLVQRAVRLCGCASCIVSQYVRVGSIVVGHIFDVLAIRHLNSTPGARNQRKVRREFGIFLASWTLDLHCACDMRSCSIMGCFWGTVHKTRFAISRLTT